MKLLYRFDEKGYYIPGEDYIGQNPVGNSTDIPPIDPEGRGMYKPRFVDGKWVEEGAPPVVQTPQLTLEEKITALEKDNKTLRLQISAAVEQNQFLEDVVTEIILLVSE